VGHRKLQAIGKAQLPGSAAKWNEVQCLRTAGAVEGSSPVAQAEPARTDGPEILMNLHPASRDRGA
jgi:hypothetical protein